MDALASKSPNKKKTKSNSQNAATGFGTKSKINNNNKSLYIPDTSTSTQHLVSFLVQQECEGLEGTQIGYCPRTGRRGLYATESFQAGDYIVGLPFPCCLTLARDDIAVGEATDADLGFRLWEYLDSDDPTTASFWGPYFQTLPTRDNQQFDATPDFWTVEQIQSLELPILVQQCLERKRDMDHLVAAAAAATTTPSSSSLVEDNENNHKVPTISDLQFATWLVKSRGFTLLKPILKEQQSSSSKSINQKEENVDQVFPETTTTIEQKTVLMPFLDMINHHAASSAPNAELQVLETKSEDESFYALQAIRPIAKGREITIHYGTGHETTLDLLSNYGFIPHNDNSSNNPNDVALMKEWHDTNNINFEWSTTLEQDVSALKALMEDSKGDDADSNIRKKVLEFRIRMKRAAKG